MLLKKKKLKFITENIKISFDDFLMINKILTKKVLMKKIKHRKLFLRKYKKVSAFESYLQKYQKVLSLKLNHFISRKVRSFFGVSVSWNIVNFLGVDLFIFQTWTENFRVPCALCSCVIYYSSLFLYQ